MPNRRTAVLITNGATDGSKSGGKFHCLQLGLCGEGARQDWSRLAIRMSRGGRFVDGTAMAAVSLLRIASVFEVFV
jgi:hypothetical protein